MSEETTESTEAVGILDTVETPEETTPETTETPTTEETTSILGGELSDEERAEYDGYVRANKFIAILRRQAQQFLGTNP